MTDLSDQQRIDRSESRKAREREEELAMLIDLAKNAKEMATPSLVLPLSSPITIIEREGELPEAVTMKLPVIGLFDRRNLFSTVVESSSKPSSPFSLRSGKRKNRPPRKPHASRVELRKNRRPKK